MNQTKTVSPVMQAVFVALMLGLTALFAYLGTWQVQRLAEKEALIAAVAARFSQPPIDLPISTEWGRLDPQSINFQPMRATGILRNELSIRIFTSLVDGHGPASGPGYWIVTPLVLQTGGAVWVNRGFVPDAQSKSYFNEPAGTGEAVELTGIARPPEAVGMFTPQADVANRIEWVRNPDRLAAMVEPGLAPFAPFYLDLPAGPKGVLPQGGETVVEFPNNHLGYAATWFGFALITPIMLGFWLWRQRRPHLTPTA